MKSIIYLFLSFCIFSNAFSQSKKVAANIDKLDNSQFIIDHTKKASFKMESKPAMKLIKYGKGASDQLIKALSDSTKTIMAHLVLCHIYFKHVSFAGPKVLVTDKGDMNKYYLGEEKGEGLVITESPGNGNYKAYVLPGDRQEIVNYWKMRAGKK